MDTRLVGRGTRSFRRARRWRIALGLAVATALLTASGIALLSARSPSSASPSWVVNGTIAVDSFDRADAPAWGSAETGGDWSDSGPVPVQLDEDAGRMAASAGSSLALLPNAVARDVSVVAVVAFAAGAMTHGEASLRARADESAGYEAAVRIVGDGSSRLALGRVDGGAVVPLASQRIRGLSELRPDEPLRIELRVTGVSPVLVEGRAWRDGSATPDWQVVARDGGASRIRGEGSIGLAAAETEVRWERIRAAALRQVPARSPARSEGRASTSAGAAEPGTKEWSVPAGSVIVAPLGRPGGSGTFRDPFGTIAEAVAAARDGATIALRRGVYREPIVLPAGKRLTIQPYRSARVWLDGSVVVSDWQRDGDRWVRAGWTRRFDDSPTYRRGAQDGEGAFSFVSPDAPLAAHPDQLWIDGIAQRQVDPGDVGPGTFALDESTDALLLGSDPTGHEVRASDLVRGVTVVGAGSVVQGIGIRRFSPSVPDLGAVLAAGEGVSFRDLTVEDSATTGLSVIAGGGTVRDVTVRRSGLLGVHANYADGLVISGLRSVSNNTEHFNRAPVSGGVKITRSRGVAIRDSTVADNEGNGIWFDESVHDVDIVGNDVRGNTGNAVIVELSARAVIADNAVLDNGGSGIWINDSGDAFIWSNTVAGSRRAINLTQSTRRASDLSLPGHDPRQTLPDPTVSWILEDIDVGANVLVDSSGNCVLCVEDFSHERAADEMAISADGDLYQRRSERTPEWLTVWSRGQGDPAVFFDLERFQEDTAQEARGTSIEGHPVIGSDGALLPATRSATAGYAIPLPDRVERAIHGGGSIAQLGAGLR